MRQFLQKYKYIIIILAFSTFVLLAYRSYTDTREAIITRYQIENDLIETSVINTVNNARVAYTIAEQQLNEQMRNYSQMLIEKYRENPEIFRGDLTQLKELVGDYDIYILDSSLKIINTTDSADLGLDFSIYPSFSNLLRERLQGDSFEVDHMDISTNTGILKKYSYIPTPDHRYLLELGIDITRRYPQLGELNIFSMADNLANEYETIGDIEIFKINKDGTSFGQIHKTINPIDIEISKEKKELISEVLKTNKTVSSEADFPDGVKRHHYIPFLRYEDSGELNWWNSYIVGITYNNNNMLTELRRQKQSFYFNILIITLVFLIFTTTMVYLLKRTEYMAYHDHLTDLPNRKLFEDLFQKKINNLRGPNNQSALLFLDLDNFKKINDKYGHNIGDKVLKAVADRLKDSLRNEDIISRLGGDEFSILLPSISSKTDAERVAAKINHLFEKPFRIEDRDYHVQISIGISTSSENGTELEKLIQKADLAMYKSKKKNLS